MLKALSHCPCAWKVCFCLFCFVVVLIGLMAWIKQDLCWVPLSSLARLAFLWEPWWGDLPVGFSAGVSSCWARRSCALIPCLWIVCLFFPPDPEALGCQPASQHAWASLLEFLPKYWIVTFGLMIFLWDSYLFIYWVKRFEPRASGISTHCLPLSRTPCHYSECLMKEIGSFLGKCERLSCPVTNTYSEDGLWTSLSSSR